MNASLVEDLDVLVRSIPRVVPIALGVTPALLAATPHTLHLIKEWAVDHAIDMRPAREHAALLSRRIALTKK